MPAHRFLVYTREDCPLCDDFIAELAAVVPQFDVADVDGDPATRRRFGPHLRRQRRLPRPSRPRRGPSPGSALTGAFGSRLL
jgi:hypothetical protein